MENEKCSLKEARNLYMREWRKKNKNKVKKYNETYWQRIAEKMNSQEMEGQACQK